MGASGAIKGTTNLPKKMSKFILKKMTDDQCYNVLIGHSNTLEDGEKLKAFIKKGHSNINSIHLMDIGCALGIHAGPGSLATAIQPV